MLELSGSEEDLKQKNRQLANANKYLNQLKRLLITELENEKLKHSESIKFQASLINDLKNFIQDERTKDFRIQISDREFLVHKFLLAARSPTLAEILRNNPEVENLNLVDISVENFEKVLKFLYTDELPRKDGTNFLHLFAAAGKLKIEELMNFAAMRLLDEIDAEDAFEVFKIAYKFEHEELKQKAFEEIKKKYPKINFKDNWSNDPEKLTQIIQVYEKKEEEVQKLLEEIRKREEEFNLLTME